MQYGVSSLSNLARKEPWPCSEDIGVHIAKPTSFTLKDDGQRHIRPSAYVQHSPQRSNGDAANAATKRWADHCCAAQMPSLVGSRTQTHRLDAQRLSHRPTLGNIMYSCILYDFEKALVPQPYPVWWW